MSAAERQRRIKLARKMRIVPLRAIQAIPDDDTVKTLATLFELAGQAEVTGIAFGCMLRDGTFLTDVVGECLRRPTFARGVVAFLMEQIAGVQHDLDATERR